MRGGWRGAGPLDGGVRRGAGRDFFKEVAEKGLAGQELGDQAVFSIDGK